MYVRCVRGLLLTESLRTVIDDGNPTRLGDEKQLVNIEKQRMNHAVISDMLAFREAPLALHPVSTIVTYLQECERYNEDVQYQKSLEWEPRGMKVTTRPCCTADVNALFLTGTEGEQAKTHNVCTPRRQSTP